MNFFDPQCSESPRVENEFGLCDDGERAFSSIDNSEPWIAKVVNETSLPVTFSAVDNCIILGDEYKGLGRCDGMLTTSEHIFFVELKNQKENWREYAFEQLESTILFFNKAHPDAKFRHKKAFACNRKHGRFQFIDQETQLRFRERTGFRIDAQATILIKLT